MVEQLQATIKALEQSRYFGDAHWADILCNLHHTLIQTKKIEQIRIQFSKMKMLKK